MNRFMTKDLMVAVLPSYESMMACADEGESNEEGCDGETKACDSRSVGCDDDSAADCDGETKACDHASMPVVDHYGGATPSERDYELLHRQLDTALEG